MNKETYFKKYPNKSLNDYYAYVANNKSNAHNSNNRNDETQRPNKESYRSRRTPSNHSSFNLQPYLIGGVIGLLLGFVFFSGQVKGLDVISESDLFENEKTFKINTLEVMTEDLGKMNLEDALMACEDLGDGWRLPTKDELYILYENKNNIGGFADGEYFYFDEEYGTEMGWQCCVDFKDGTPSLTWWHENSHLPVRYVRAVRDL